MKREKAKTLVILLTGTILLVGGCGKDTKIGRLENETEVAENTADSPDAQTGKETGAQTGKETGAQTASSSEGGVEVDTKTYEKEFLSDDEQKLVEMKIEYPVIGGDTEVSAAINGAVSKVVEEYEEQASQNAKDLKTDNLYQEESALLPYGFEAKSVVSYNQKGILNIRFTGYDFTGGAHGNPWERDLLFDTANGKSLTAADVFTSMEAGKEAATDAFAKKIEEDPDIFFPDALDTLKEADFMPDFYLAQDGVHFYAMPYELGPYASGTIEVVVPYSAELIKLHIVS